MSMRLLGFDEVICIKQQRCGLAGYHVC